MSNLEIKRLLNLISIWKLLTELPSNNKNQMVLLKIQNVILSELQRVGELTKLSFDREKKEVSFEIDCEEIIL